MLRAMTLSLAKISAAVATPALRHPILVLESDDWGAEAVGRVQTQASALARVARLLLDVRDATGRPAIMTIGLVSGIIDRETWHREHRYARLTLTDASQAPFLEVLKEGIAAGVFAVQWHGMEHYWPAALISSQSLPEVERWLNSDAPTEDLPPPLQSRWTDATVRPSRALPPQAVADAVEEEKRLLLELFGRVPTVAVPNTFVWDDTVERAWRHAGVRFVVTCGRRYAGRDANGRLRDGAHRIYDGQRARTGVYYLVRDVYFEPALGHMPQRLLEGLARRTAQARACLVETHRFNYVGEAANRSLAALREALLRALDNQPDLRFASSEEVGEALVSRHPDWGRIPRLRELWLRLRGV